MIQTPITDVEMETVSMREQMPRNGVEARDVLKRSWRHSTLLAAWVAWLRRGGLSERSV